MLTKGQYERLRPYLPVINMFGRSQVYVGGDLTEVDRVWQQLNNPPCCFGCQGDVARMLKGIYDATQRFERENSDLHL